MTYQELIRLAEDAEHNARMRENIDRLLIEYVDTGKVRWELTVVTDTLPSVSLNLEYFVDKQLIESLVEQIRETMKQRSRDALTTLREESHAFLEMMQEE